MKKCFTLKKNEKKNGFTLVELLAVVVIVAIIASVSVGVYLNSIKASKEKATLLAINNVKSAAELYSKEDSESFGWNYSYDKNGEKTGSYVCLSVQQLINGGFFNANFFEKDIYEDRINVNSFIEVRKNLNSAEYETKINTTAKSRLDCEVTMTNDGLNFFDISNINSYTDYINFKVNLKNKDLKINNNLTIRYNDINDEVNKKTGKCTGAKCELTKLKDDNLYEVQLCLSGSTDDDNVCEYVPLRTSKFANTFISFSPKDSVYYYRDVSISYNDSKQKIFGTPIRYFKSDINGTIDNNQVIYRCTDYNNCSNVRASSIEKGILYKVDDSAYNKNNKSIKFSIIEDVDFKKSSIYTMILDPTGNVGNNQEFIPEIKTGFNVNYLNVSNKVTGNAPNHVCKYGYDCVLSKNSFTNVGYIFKGWKLNESNILRNPGYKFKQTKMLKSNELNYYGQWSAINYNINYILNNGNYGNSHPNLVKYDEDFVVNNPSKTVKFVGNANGTGAIIANNNLVASQKFKGWDISGMDTTTHVINNTNNKFDNLKNILATKFRNLRSTSGTVTFVANWENKNVTVPTVTKSGYKCGWSTSSTGKTIEYDSGGSYNISNNTNSVINLYAVCEEIKMYYLDVNAYIDGEYSGWLGVGTKSIASVDVYIDGKLVGNDVKDLFKAYSSGTKYEIKDIKAFPEVDYLGPHNNISLSGVLNSNVNIDLDFKSYVICGRGNTYTDVDNSVIDITSEEKYNAVENNNRDLYPRKSFNVKVYKWAHKVGKNECDDIKRSKLKRKYSFEEYSCQCFRDNKTKQVCSAKASKNFSNITHTGDHKMEAVIIYVPTEAGQGACKDKSYTTGKGKKAKTHKAPGVNSFVDRVCFTDPRGLVANGKSAKNVEKFYHGFMFYGNGDGINDKFSSGWTHNVKGYYTNRPADNVNAANACLHACKLKYN